jgi:ATP-dependent DNA helicase RecG
MEIAIKTMMESVDEPRADGKASPKVGAVLLKPGGAPHDTAYRGELRHGDHAEFTLLERENRDRKLDDCVLFTTLEPCAPGARRHPKLSCAERILLARIKEVWVGIQDPDPTVDRKGIKFLQDNGVAVHMFDRDLQEVIREANREFIDQALERAAAEEESQPRTITLSTLENAFADAVVGDFSVEALEQYRDAARIADEIGSAAFNRRLVQQGLVKHESSQLTPTGFGLVLFGKEPRTAMPQAGLLGTVHYPDGREQPKDFDGPQIFAPEDALQWLRDKMPNPIDRSGARRRELREPLLELARAPVDQWNRSRWSRCKPSTLRCSAATRFCTMCLPRWRWPRNAGWA